MSSPKILFPTDFSYTGDLAYLLAASFARHTQSELMIVHVREPAAAYSGASYHGKVDPSTDDLARMLGKLGPRDKRVACSRHLITGKPAEAITRFAREHDVDLIVIGTRGLSCYADVFLGSVAEEVIQNAPCPVLAIKTAGHTKTLEALVTDIKARARPTMIGVKELIELVDELVTVCVDSARGLQEAASDANHRGLRILLAERGAQRADFAEELQTLATLRGAVPERKGSLSGAIQREWMHVKAVLGLEDDKAVLDACIKEEEHTALAYEGALALGLPNDVREALERHLREIILLDRALTGIKESGVLDLRSAENTSTRMRI